MLFSTDRVLLLPRGALRHGGGWEGAGFVIRADMVCVHPFWGSGLTAKKLGASFATEPRSALPSHLPRELRGVRELGQGETRFF